MLVPQKMAIYNEKTTSFGFTPFLDKPICVFFTYDHVHIFAKFTSSLQIVLSLLVTVLIQRYQVEGVESTQIQT